MKTIIDLEIAPTERAAVTPCELLEDFADSTPAWHFLEEESRYYAALKGVCACILRHFQPEPYRVIDFVFSGCDAHAESALRLVLIDVGPPHDPLKGSSETLLSRGSKWRWGPVEDPEEPTCPSFCPQVTASPTATATENFLRCP